MRHDDDENNVIKKFGTFQQRKKSSTKEKIDNK